MNDTMDTIPMYGQLQEHSWWELSSVDHCPSCSQTNGLQRMYSLKIYL